MSDKVSGGIKAGSTSVSVNFILTKTADGTEQTGKVAADMTASYQQQGGARVAISLSDLAAVTSAYSSGGVKEIDATNMPGLYRLDLPNGAVAAGADWVTISVKVASCFVYFERFALETKGAAEVNTLIAAGVTVTTNSDKTGYSLSVTPPTAAQIAAVILTTPANLLVTDSSGRIQVQNGTATGQISLSAGAVLLQATQTGVTIPTVTTITNGVSVASGGITAASIASAAFTAAKFAADSITAAALAADAVTEIVVGIEAATLPVNIQQVNGNAVSDVSGALSVNVTLIRGSDVPHDDDGLLSVNAASWAGATITTGVPAVPGDAMTLEVGERTSIAAAVWNTLRSVTFTVGSFGEKIKLWLAQLGTDNRVLVSANTHTSGETVAGVTGGVGGGGASTEDIVAALEEAEFAKASDVDIDVTVELPG